VGSFISLINAPRADFGRLIAIVHDKTRTKEWIMNRKALPVLALLIVVIGTVAAPATAQSRRKISLEAAVPFEFVVGNRPFPAGNYTFEMATGSPKTTDQSGVLVVRSRERNLYAAVATGVAADANTHVNPKLTFVHDGERVMLSKVWRPGNVAGLSVHTAGGEETEASGRGDAITLDAMAVTEKF
jgi:hypothetical protein